MTKKFGKLSRIDACASTRGYKTYKVGRPSIGPTPITRECIRGCGRVTKLSSQFHGEEFPQPTCSYCDNEEEQRMTEEENEGD